MKRPYALEVGPLKRYRTFVATCVGCGNIYQAEEAATNLATDALAVAIFLEDGQKWRRLKHAGRGTKWHCAECVFGESVPSPVLKAYKALLNELVDKIDYEKYHIPISEELEAFRQSIRGAP